jgi:hypothetical protein
MISLESFFDFHKPFEHGLLRRRIGGPGSARGSANPETPPNIPPEVPLPPEQPPLPIPTEPIPGPAPTKPTPVPGPPEPIPPNTPEPNQPPQPIGGEDEKLEACPRSKRRKVFIAKSLTMKWSERKARGFSP